jgi:cold shock CspA family protein
MTSGKITKLVKSYGSTWGRITPAGETREVFFNAANLVERSDYEGLVLGQDVEFDEEPDRANGTHAVRVSLGAAEKV